jgi:hypothetical protein
MICSSVCCLHNCLEISHLYDVYSTDVCQPVQYCMISAQLYDICTTVCMMSAYCYQYDVYSTLYYLLFCVILPRCVMSAQLYNVCLPIYCLPTSLMSAYLHDFNSVFDVCLPVWCLPTVWYLLNCMMSAYLYDFFNEWCLLNCIMSAYLSDVFLSVWYLLNCMISAYLSDVYLPVLYVPSSALV